MRWSQSVKLLYIVPGNTVYRGTWNFEPSRRICPFPQNFYFLWNFSEFSTSRW